MQTNPNENKESEESSQRFNENQDQREIVEEMEEESHSYFFGLGYGPWKIGAQYKTTKKKTRVSRKKETK